MIKYYALQKNSDVEVVGVQESEQFPTGAIPITKENYNSTKTIIRKYDRKIVNDEVQEKTDEEKEATRTQLFLQREKNIASFKAGRRSFRLVRQPFTYGNVQIKLEESDLRTAPQASPFNTWNDFIRDAVLCELTGNSILPIKLETTTGQLEIAISSDLYAVHASMTSVNKKTLEGELAIKAGAKEAESYSEVQEIRQENREREKETIINIIK